MKLVRVLSAEYEDFLRDESRLSGNAESISFPKTEAEVVELVKYFDEKGEGITIQGARTGLAAGAVPYGGHVMNLSRMTKILGLRYDEKKDVYYLRVQSGVLLSQVRKALENKAFDIADWSKESVGALRNLKAGEWFFSPDPTEPTASIGGMASCNASGARSFLYGSTREHINALRVVLADGSITVLERGVNKANSRDFSLPLLDDGELKGSLPPFDSPHTKDAGFFFHSDMDLVDLFMGSQGTLGIITELELALMKTPKLMWGLTTFLPSDEAALKYVRILRGDELEGMPQFKHKPASLEYFNQRALNMLLDQKKVTPAFQQIQEIKPGFESAVYAEFNEQNPEELWPTLEKISEVIIALGGDPDNTWVANCARELDKLIFFRHAVSESINMVIDENRKNEPTLTLLSGDMAVPDCEFENIFHFYEDELKKTNLHWVIFGHVGENHFHPNILPRNKEELDLGHEVIRNWARKVSEMGGTVSAEHGTGKLKRDLAQIMYGKEKLEQMRAFKNIFDPKGILCPGNIIG